GGDDPDDGLEGVHVAGQVRHLHAHDLRQIHFIDHHDVRAQKHVWMFLHHVRALGDAHHHHPAARAERELRGTNKIADVFDGAEVGFFEVELEEGLAHEIGVQMTAVDGG